MNCKQIQFNMSDLSQQLFPFGFEQNQQERKVTSPFSAPFDLTSSQYETKKRGRKPNPISSEKPRKLKSQDQKNPNQKFGHWSIEQNKRYHWFLEIHSSHFLMKHLRRMDKIFKIMAKFVGTREAQQCRSHHQKMQKKYTHNFCKILLNLRRLHYDMCDSQIIVEDMTMHSVEFDKILSSDELSSELIKSEKTSTSIEQEKQNNADSEEQKELDQPFLYEEDYKNPQQIASGAIDINDILSEMFQPQYNLFS